MTARAPLMAEALTLPWPDRALSPNGRVHWAVKGKAVKAARTLAWATAREAGWHRVPLAGERLHLWIDFYPPDRRRYDDDNLLGRFKAYRDGLADALHIDDRLFASHPLLHDTPRPGGCVVVRITPTPENPSCS